MGKIGKRALAFLALLILISGKAKLQDTHSEMHHVLYVNSYALGYYWTDSLISGIQKSFSSRPDIQLYTEFLDGKRFGQAHFDQLYKLFKEKYRAIRFDAVITTDNDALDFIMMYGDSLAPGVPRIFGGINNPGDYSFKDRAFYGIRDAVDLKQEIDLIIRVMPGCKKIYFITDKSTTSLSNLGIVKQIEPLYVSHLKFEYIHNYAPDSLLKAVSEFEKGNAIALINYYQDDQGNPVNVEATYSEIARRSVVPIITDNESLLGNGLAGGLINNGVTHGRELAELTLKFINNKDYRPDQQIIRTKGISYFDYQVLKRYNISEKLLPKSSVIINKPQSFFNYLKYIFLLLAIIGLLLFINMLLYMNVKRRKTAEEMVRQKLDEISEKNKKLEHAQMQVNEMNAELEEINEHLSKTNAELIQAREKSEESDRLKSAFLANMSHEIRTPLNAILGFSSLLSDASMSGDDREEYFRIITSSSDLLLHIIDDILDLSKIEAGQLKIFTESFSVNDLLIELVNSFRPGKGDDLVDVSLSIPEDKSQIMLHSDPMRFKQIFSNLLSNAVKFTHKGMIQIGYHFNLKDEITFFVKDPGIGIEKKDLDNIFSRFWKSNEQGERYYAGTGLGLSITKKLSEALGGRIWVESTPKIGSTFYVAFPTSLVKKSNSKTSGKSPADSGHQNWKGFTIAIAEDETYNLYLLTRILKKLQVEIISFKNGKEIVDFFQDRAHQKVDLILMDIKMPGMDGYTATNLIRKLEPRIPIIAQTAYAMVEDVNKIKSSSFDDYISKPIRPGLLIEKVKKFLYPEHV
ncbi:MAG: ATP-binding protein [Bacteroidales bacterium]